MEKSLSPAALPINIQSTSAAAATKKEGTDLETTVDQICYWIRDLREQKKREVALEQLRFYWILSFFWFLSCMRGLDIIRSATDWWGRGSGPIFCALLIFFRVY